MLSVDEKGTSMSRERDGGVKQGTGGNRDVAKAEKEDVGVFKVSRVSIFAGKLENAE